MTQPAVRLDTATRSAASSGATRSVLRWRGWRPALWVLALAAVAVDWAVTYVASVVLLLANAGVCFEPSTAAKLETAQRGFLCLLAALATPWLIAGIRSHHRLRVAAFGVAGLAFALMGTIQTLMDTPADFTMSWCLF